MTGSNPNDAPAVIGTAKSTAKHDATTRAATENIWRERAERDARTGRLRAARLKRDAELSPVVPS